MVGCRVRLVYRTGVHPRISETEIVGILIQTHLNRPTVTLKIPHLSGRVVHTSVHTSRIVSLELA
jgi:hypothetical protein